MGKPEHIEAGGGVTLDIRACGAALDPAIGVRSADVWLAAGKVARARIVVLDGDPATGAFPVSDSEQLAPGSPITIALGYGGNTREVFKGIVQAHSIDIASENECRLVIEARAQETSADSAVNAAPALALTYGESIISLRATADVERPDIHGEVCYQGSSAASPGDCVTLAGLGQRFNGDMAVSLIHHRVSDGNWITTATMGAPSSSTPLRQTIATRSELRVDLDDAGRALELSTPYGQRVRLDDEAQAVVISDAHGNAVRLDRNGIAIDSKKGIAISAAGDISVKAQGHLALEGRAGVTIAGMSIDARADLSFKAHGSAASTLSAEGEVTVRGAIVMIN